MDKSTNSLKLPAIKNNDAQQSQSYIKSTDVKPEIQSMSSNTNNYAIIDLCSSDDDEILHISRQTDEREDEDTNQSEPLLYDAAYKEKMLASKLFGKDKFDIGRLNYVIVKLFQHLHPGKFAYKEFYKQKRQNTR